MKSGVCNTDARIRQYREKHKRCAYCQYLGCRNLIDKEYFYCKVSLKPKFHITRRIFCRYYKVKEPDAIPYNDFIHPQPYNLPIGQMEYKGRIVLYDKNNPPPKDYLENLTGDGPFYYYLEEKTNE